MIRKKSPSAVAIASLVAILAQTATKGTEQKRPCYKLWAEDRGPEHMAEKEAGRDD